MYIKDRTYKTIFWIYIFISTILGLFFVYAIIDTMVSLKYEHEKELLSIHTNTASIYLKQVLQYLYISLSYVIINIIFIGITGYIKIKHYSRKL